MSLRWGADDDTLSRGMDAGGKEIASEGTDMSRSELDAWEKRNRRRAVGRDRSAKGAALQNQQLFKSQLAAQSAGQLVQAGIAGAQAGTAGARYENVKGAQAGTAAKQSRVAGKLDSAQAGEGPFGGKGLFGRRQEVLQNRQQRLAARQTKLGEQRLGMEEKNPYLTTKYRY